MWSHVSLGVKSYKQSCEFYKETLSILLNQSLFSYEGQYAPFYHEEALMFPGVRFTNFVDNKNNHTTTLKLIFNTFGENELTVAQVCQSGEKQKSRLNFFFSRNESKSETTSSEWPSRQ